MIRNLKVLGLALVAVAALTAVSASAASAASFHSLQEPTTLKGSAVTNQVFTTPTGTVTCTNVSLVGDSVTKKTTETVTAHPNYTGCSAKIGESNVSAFVDFTECDYSFPSATNGEGMAEPTINCPAGQAIHIKVTALKANCYTIPGGQTLNGVRYDNTNKGSGSGDIDVVATVTGITAEKAGICGSGTVNNATYEGSVTVQGEGTEIWYE